jgi:hypothetical protein
MRGFGKPFCAGIIALATVALPVTAHAADVTTPTVTSANGKGIVGGALLGAEAVMLTEAAANVKPAWAYAVGGGLGAIGGGVGGYFAEQTGDAKLSLCLLVGGMALALPTTVAVLSASAYEPVNYVEDHPPSDEPVAEPGRAAPSSSPSPEPPSAEPPAATPSPDAPAPTAPAAPAPSGRATVHHTSRIAALPKVPSLVGLGGGKLTLSVPAVEVRHVYTRTEVAVLGVKQQTEVEVPVLNVVF